MDSQSGTPTFDDYLLARSIFRDAWPALRFASLAVPDGATGLGLALIELSTQAGVPTIAGAYGEAQQEGLRAHGATHVIRRDSIEFARGVMSVTEGRGADAIVDQVAGPDFAVNFEMIADFGNVLVTGWGNGDPPKLFDTLWAALDRCPCMQLWTIERYRSNDASMRELEQDARALLDNPSRPRFAVGA